MNRRPTFSQQSIALLNRNILLKRKNITQNLAQLLLPLLAIGMIFLLLKNSAKLQDRPEVPDPLGTGDNWNNTKPLEWEWIVGPKNAFTDDIVNQIKDAFNLFPKSRIRTLTINNSFTTVNDIFNYCKNDSKRLAIIFDDISTANPNISYTIRMPSTNIGKKEKQFFGSIVNCREDPFSDKNSIPIISKCPEMHFYLIGFTFIQTLVDSAIIRSYSANSSDLILPNAKLYVYPKEKTKTTITTALVAITAGICFVFLQLSPFLTSHLVKEKEKKIKEAMLMMGLRPMAYWLVWFALEAVIMIALSLVFSFGIYWANIVPKSGVILIWVLMVLFAMTTIEMSAIFTNFFEKEKTSTKVISVVIFFPVAIILGLSFIEFPLITKYFLSLLSPFALLFGVKSILTITYLNDSTLTLRNILIGTDFSFAMSIIYLVLDFILYALLAIYLDQVMPGQYGSKRNLCFCFTKDYWFPKKSVQTFRTNLTQKSGDIEEVSEEMKRKASIITQNISKKFKNQTTYSVNKISLTIYKSEITALLGHNGAGKTTLIHMLLGAIAPTSGTAYIYGHDVTNASQMYELRSMIGVCLQENILFDELNAEEHLYFFGQMKGMQRIAEEVKRLLISVDLFQNRYTSSQDLSGGQKRKLCIAIALIGNPKVIVLDEPTSGVDAAIRRQIWNIIRLHKSDKTIIMTTHSMEEADQLCDRKAIISRGRLRCAGSSPFLKRKFGVGYHLAIDVRRDANIEDITRVVKTQIPNSTFERFTGSEVFYVLPQNQSQNFPKLFGVLEKRVSAKSQINSFGVSMTTLEEVFLKLEAEEEAGEKKMDKMGKRDVKAPDPDIGISNYTGYNRSLGKTFGAYFYIVFLLNLRNPGHLIILNLTILIFFFTFLILNHWFINSGNTSDSTLIDTNIYDKNQAILKYQNKSNGDLNELISIVNKLGVKPELITNLKPVSLNNSYMALIINSFKKDDIQWKWIFNETHTYSLPILHNLMANTYFGLINSGSDRLIRTTDQPFPWVSEENKLLVNVVAIGSKVGMLYLIIVIIEAIAHQFSLDVIDDRETKVIETIRISGMGFWCYWLTNLFMHTLILAFEIALIVVLFAVIIGFDHLVTITLFLLFALHLLLGGVSLLLMLYVFGHLFRTKTAAQILTLYFVIITLIVLVLYILFIYFWRTGSVLFALIFGAIWPAFSVVIGQVCMLLYGYGWDLFEPYFYQLMIAISFVSLISGFFLYLFLLKIADSLTSGYDVFGEFGIKCKKHSTDLPVFDCPLEDQDVIQERNEVTDIIQKRNKNIPILLVHRLRKVFFKSGCCGLIGQSGAPEIAVNNLSLKIDENNIFGLLGPNGAGKTTTMKLILKQEIPTNGLVWFNGQEVKASELHNQIGYCPQHDTLWKDITLREHLRLFAAIRGIKTKDIDRICNKYMKDLKIIEHADKRTEHLSGGTKRKLCYILSLFGPSRLVLLDEPSTGMDPHSKRFLWTTIQNLFSKNSYKSSILTTHSMEEASALCTRIAIMTKGVMRCIGSVQHLKNKYGAGYVLDIKWNSSQTKPDLVKQIVSNIFSEWKVREEFDNRLTADIPQESVRSLSTIFSSLENAKNSPVNGIEEYSFSQTTLEQVFIYFAKQHQIVSV